MEEPFNYMKNQIKTSLIKYIVLAIVGIATAVGAIGFLYTSSRASTENATVTGSATPSIIGDNQTTVVTFRFDVADPTRNVLDGLDLQLTYNDILEYQSYEVVDNYLETILQEDTETPGKLRFMLGTTKFGNQRKTSATVRITFKAKARGEGVVTATTQSLVSGTNNNAINPKAFSVASNVPVTIVVNAGPTPTLTPGVTQDVPTNTPVPPSVTAGGPSPTTSPGCPLQPQGDANCDGVINVVDFVGWRNYYLGIDFAQKSQFNPNFNGSGQECVDAKDQPSAYCLTDLQIWTTTVTK